ncbi:hypothetical protein McpCs1_16540 [Methanocorpusculaceae archaeon Cs1]|uniref:Ppx/GppA phosphatase C-terminal domain-containing protein n=1 Tax=Methanorbis rubei TaxID=3028300 RepID=A0AAE4MI05_9EURY|nr:hypothetical protein [Methanocorpusculaceae archaeon Cs1]
MYDSAKILNEDFCHADQVSRLALALYDCLVPARHHGKQTRRILAAASLLHDVGWGITGGTHNKTGMEFVLHDRTLPFTPRERILISLIVRYHRGALPKRRHFLYGDLSRRDRKLVDLISGIIRVADGLDRSHMSIVRSVSVELSNNTILITCEGAGRGSPEQRTALKKADMLMKVFSSGIRIRWKTVK